MSKQSTDYAVQLIPVTDLRPGPGNLRDGQSGWPEASPELAASIKAVGILEPLIVRQTTATPVLPGDKITVYEVIAGHRRASAAKLAELKEVPAFVRQYTDTKALQVALVENLQREDLSPIEEARGLRQLLDTGMPQTTAAKEIGRSQSHVSKRLELLKLPAAAQAYLDQGKLRVADALVLAKLPEPTVLSALHQIEELTFRRAGEVEQLIRKVADKAKPAGKGARAGQEAVEDVPPTAQTWELTKPELITFRELARHRITKDAAVRSFRRQAAKREAAWADEDLGNLIALAWGDTSPKRRGKDGRRK